VPQLTEIGFCPKVSAGVFMAISPSPMKKGLIIVVAVVLAPVLLVGLVAMASGDWRQIGSTAGGDQILVSSVTAPRKGLRSAWIRVEYKEPAKLPQGGPFVELRARVRFNCGGASAMPGFVANSEWFYSRDRGGKLVVSKKTHRDDQFGQVAEGGFGEIAKDFVCKQK
jgi:surface-adhesin protein E